MFMLPEYTMNDAQTLPHLFGNINWLDSSGPQFIGTIVVNTGSSENKTLCNIATGPDVYYKEMGCDLVNISNSIIMRLSE